MAEVSATITYLEMLKPPSQRFHAPINLPLAMMVTDDIPIHYYRYLYDTIGAGHYWIDRKILTDHELCSLIHADTTEITILYCRGVPAGYFELSDLGTESVELAYFGILPDFRGMGLARYLLSCALDRAWEDKPDRVHIQTNTLDHPAALPLYQKMGFAPFAQETRTLDVDTIPTKTDTQPE